MQTRLCCKASYPLRMGAALATLLCLFIGQTTPVAGAEKGKPDPQVVELFEKQVRPVLAKHCYSCHGPSQQFSSLRVDSIDYLLKGGLKGHAIVPGKAAESLLVKSIRHEGLQMPMGGGKLKDEEIAAIETWINGGAPWPDAAKGPLRAGDPGFYEKILKEHWAYQRVRELQPPPVKDQAWSEHPVDRFTLAAMVRTGLKPSPPVDRRTLIRRLSFVLTGLPPTPLEIDLFERDPSPGAYERLVDRILASPHYGEHWARHWMDVIRFGETFGNDWNYEIHGAWNYRDYLIRAFNQDVRYDQFIREAFAGDLLENPRINHDEGIIESPIGTAFLRMGELGHDDCVRFREIRTDVVDNQIDTLGKAFQGLTIACARCHDHKLDPIPTADYYALYGVLTSARSVTRTADLPGFHDAARQRLQELKPPIRAELARLWMLETEKLPRYLMAAHRAWKGLPPEATDLSELSLERIQAGLSLLQKPKPEMEDPLFPWLQAAHASPGISAADWQKLAARYDEESRARAAFNQGNFQPLGDLQSDGFGGWSRDGNALAVGLSPSGDFAVAGSGPEAVTGVFPAGIYTHALSARLNGALRSPLVPKDKKFVSIQVLGGGLGARRAILDNCMLNDDYKVLDHDSLAWLKIPNRDDQKDLPFYIELVTKPGNARIPERPNLLKATQEQLDSPHSYFGIARAVVHQVDETPRDELMHMHRLMAGEAPPDVVSLAQRYAAVSRQALAAWGRGQASDDDARWINWLLQNRLLPRASDLSPQLRALVSEYRAIESRIGPPRVFHGMADVDPGYDFPVLAGGDARHPGKPVPRGFLQLVSHSDGGFKAPGSGRRELAEIVASPENPLTARLMVNRIWQHLFGRGIVSTADNFGVYGEPPSHPELLDYLASSFIRDGWSVKKHIRFLVLSQTFQQSSQPSPGAMAADPLNRLLTRYPIRRLEAESIRDAILASSGRLDRTLYGPSINPYREQPKDYRRLFQGPLDGAGRRSVYLKVTRHEGARFLEIFDFPNPTVARGVRDVTNVPPQALALMNDPFVADQAGVWADRLINQTASIETRIDAMFLAALGRPPEMAEAQRFRGLVTELASQHKVADDKILTSRDLWQDLAHAMFNLKEFVYIR